MSSVQFLEKHPKFVRSGWLYKQGGSVKTVTKRYCVLFGNELFYYTHADAEEHKGSIVLLEFVRRIEEAVEFQKKGTFGKPQVLKNCIVIPGTKREYKFWSDSSIIADEWVESINLTLQKMKIGVQEEEEEEDEEDGDVVDGSTSRGNFIVGNSYGDDIDGRISGDNDYSTNNMNANDKQSQEDALLRSCTNEKDGFESQLYTTQTDFIVHQTLRSTKWVVEPYSRRKKRNQSTMTFEKAILEANPGDIIELKLGKHFITRTIYVDRGVEIIGEEPSEKGKHAEVVMLQEEEDALAVPQPMLCLIAPLVRISNIKFTYACMISEQTGDKSDIETFLYDDFVFDSRTVMNQMLNAGVDMIASQRQTLGVHLAKSLLQISRGQVIFQNCQIATMHSPATERIQQNYDGIFTCGSSEVLLFNCEIAYCKHGISAAVNSNLVMESCTIRDMCRHGVVVTQKASATLQNCELLRNERCGACFLNHTKGSVRNCKFRSCTLSISDNAAPEITQNVFVFPSNKESDENVQTQTSIVVYSGNASGEFSKNTLTCSSIYGNGTAPILCLCLTEQSRVNVTGNQFKREGGDHNTEPFALCTGKAQVIVPDDKQRSLLAESVKCYEQGRVTVGV
jgi:hypothetical protein